MISSPIIVVVVVVVGGGDGFEEAEEIGVTVSLIFILGVDVGKSVC